MGPTISVEIPAAAQTSQNPGAQAPAEKSQSNLFDRLVESTNNDQVVSDKAIQDLVTGDADNVQQVVMAVAKAEMSFQMFMEIRNKLIESYNELMRMQF